MSSYVEPASRIFGKRCEDASYSKTLRAKPNGDAVPFRESFGVRTRPGVAFNCNQPLSGMLSVSLGRPTFHREK
jgi:hypothetical protein